MRAGDAFLIRDKNIDEHLWVIISDPTIDGKQVVVVNFTTSHPKKERFCLIQAGEHPFVTRETCIAYNFAKITSLAKLIQNRDQGDITPQDPVSPVLLTRIRQGVPLSNLMPLKCVAIMAKQKLF